MKCLLQFHLPLMQEGLLLLLLVGRSSLSHARMRIPSLIEIAIISLAILISHVVGLLLQLTLHDTLPVVWSPPHNTQLWTIGWCCTWEAFWISCGNANNFFISASIYCVISLFWANNILWVYKSNTPFFWSWLHSFCTS